VDLLDLLDIAADIPATGRSNEGSWTWFFITVLLIGAVIFFTSSAQT